MNPRNTKLENLPQIPEGTEDVVVAKADSGASQHYFREKDSICLSDITTESGPPITLPNGESIESRKVGTLPIEGLSKKTTKMRILPGLTSASLISLGQLADGGCKIGIYEERLNVTKDKKNILVGLRNKEDGLYDIPIPTN